MIDDNSMTRIIKPSKKIIQKNIIVDNDKSMIIEIQQDLKNNIVNLAKDYENIQGVLK